MALQTTLDAQAVTEEVLRTVMIEINSKPLGSVSSDVADPDPVTHNLLLMGRHGCAATVSGVVVTFFQIIFGPTSFEIIFPLSSLDRSGALTSNQTLFSFLTLSSPYPFGQ